MKIVIAPDSFKECASAAEVAEAIATGVRRALPEAEIVEVPMADGGEGTVGALVAATQGRTVSVSVTGPLGDTVTAAYGILGDGETAVIEMAAASGLHLVPSDRRDPRVTTTRGTGELMRHALDQGVRTLIVGIGGSATNDGGAGMAQALGYALLDESGAELPPGGAALAYLARIDGSGQHDALARCTLRVACDVDNPLTGDRGASCVYGPQKGADEIMARELDAALAHYGAVVEGQLGVPVMTVPGAGAAGGLGAGLLAFAGAKLQAGVDIVAEAANLAERVCGAELVITGEGRIDGQTVHGKTPIGVARVAQAQDIPVIAIAGSLGEGYEAVYDHGITAAFSICKAPMTVAEAIRNAGPLLAATAESIVRSFEPGLPRGAM